MKRTAYLILFILFYINCYPQFSKTHYIPPLSGSSSLQAEEQYLYISTPTSSPINFKIIELGGKTITGTVSKNSPYRHTIGTGNDTQLQVDASQTSTIVNNKGYIVEAEDMVYVSARVTVGNGTADSKAVHAGELVSKGIAALGTRFRIGAFTNTLTTSNYGDIHTTFISILATENNTTVNFDDIKAGVSIINNASAGNNPDSIILNSGESYIIAVQGPTPANKDGLIGALVTSDKPIAVNCGSFGGTNAVANLDLGFDQIVSAERTGTDYIFIKSTGVDEVEKVILVADEDNTEIFTNGTTTPVATINAGEYYSFLGYDFSADGNLYVKTSKKVFAYQSVGDNGSSDQRNQELFFVPPLSCQTPNVIDNIPEINAVGNKKFTGRVTIVTLSGATLKFNINGKDYSIAALPSIGVSVVGPTDVIGNSYYQTYTITGLTGNVAVKSSGELYLAAYGSSGAATFGGYYSGFTFKPEVSFEKLDSAKSGCIPNIKLAVNSLSPFDIFQWYFNDVLIPGATNSSYTPLNPGYYYVSATISGCGSPVNSDIIPVSDCPSDSDNDTVCDNIDLDFDNDGITNCTESYGNQNFNLTNPAAGNITAGNYSNSYVGSVTFDGIGTPSSSPITGTSDGNFVTEATLGENNSVSYTVSNFTKPISLSVEYASIASVYDLFTSATEVRIACPTNRTLTIVNPNNQILIDTNYDGIFENGITEYSSFEIRFRLNGNTPLPAGSGNFTITGNLINSLSITNINLSDSDTSRIALRLVATCIPKDTDNDGVDDQHDLDSDNDTLPDYIESQGQNIIPYSNKDNNKDGIDDAFGTGITPSDSDNDAIVNSLDLDSDNDGIYDLDESGSGIADTNNDGIADGTDFGTNGLANSIETTSDSGTLNYSIADTDSDKIYNYLELDSDNDLCYDVVEAGYSDSNNDGLLGTTAPPTVNNKGIVTGGSGYGNPNSNYITAAPISISKQPQDITNCEFQSASFSVTSNPVNTYQWEVSADNGATWNSISDNAVYTGTTTSDFNITNLAASMNGYQYRVFLNKIGNSCGLLSAAAVLTVLYIPANTVSVSLIQCDEDSDGITAFNLTQKNADISSNYQNENFSYYTTLVAANSQNSAFLIADPVAYVSGNTTVFARVENENGCAKVTQMDLTVSVTQIPYDFIIPNLHECDDYIDSENDDKDGISKFDFSSITASLLTVLPNNVTVNYYKSEADFLAETDAAGNSLAIQTPSNYRNIGYQYQQKIWVRVDSTLDNSCYGYKTFDIFVEKLPNIATQDTQIICLPKTQEIINAGIIDGTPASNYTYQWYKNGTIINGATKSTLIVSSEGKYSVIVANAYQCSRTRTVDVIGSEIAGIQSVEVSDFSENNTIVVNVTGSGNYEFALDDISGPYQDSNVFTNVLMGFHDLYIRDKNGCGILGPVIAPVLGVPKYFTPNSDGYNDYWNVRGVSPLFNNQTTVSVFDRYGKLLWQFNATNNGWDGTYNGQALPADDYWYSIKLEDGRTAKGHFTLKR